MQKQDIFRSLQDTVEKLTVDYAIRYPYIPLFEKQLPETKALVSVLETLRVIMFPGYFGSPLVNMNSMSYHTGVNVEKLYNALSEQIYRTLTFSGEADDLCTTRETACELSEKFIGRLPEIKRLLSTDVHAIYTGDPAAKDYTEVIFCYPAMRALLNYRVAHELFMLGIPIIPRIISEIAHSETGIDIHPEAQIGEYFSIDHGTGVVIGQTTIIGKHVRLYQGVTLGAKSFILDDDGNPMDVPRHPILEDDVTVYSNSSILGRITIGKGTVIGGNVWLTHDVPPNSRIVQSKFTE